MKLKADTSIQYLKGVGEKRAALYHKLGIFTVEDLLWHLPRDYIDLTSPKGVLSAVNGEMCPVRAFLVRKGREQRIRAGLSVFKLTARSEDGGELEVTVFNSKYTVENLKIDEEYIFLGRTSGSMLRKQMTAPSIFPIPEDNAILPIYPQTSGLSSTIIRRQMSEALELADDMTEPIPADMLSRYGLISIQQAIRDIHFPHCLEDAEAARERFVFHELLVLSLCLGRLHDGRASITIPPLSTVDMEPFYASLPFSPTAAQLRCIDEAMGDFMSGVPMNRLVQGDVGSGKTLVVAACCYVVWKNNMQCAVMAPTEILAQQHLDTLSSMLGGLGMRISLLTGSTPASQKREVKAALASGETDLCIGTHAILSDGVEFCNLSLVVTDEQHRFGVAQRTKLSQKSENCHVLVLSATPIPRTLSLIIYGDLSLSIIDTLPPGRKPVETLVINSAKRERALGFIKKALDEGRQAYLVCPLVEMGEIDTGLKPAVQYAQRLASREFKSYSVGLLHGRMNAKDKDETMRRFKNGEIKVLVSTTVVEVGVDVPNASIIMIENAERFGLSQLHQLRGRVGRGKHKSWCILVSDAKGAAAKDRLMVMKTTSDGFKVAERDLKLRGPGDFFGYRQHGLPDLRVASLADNLDVLSSAQQCARQILDSDPDISLPQHRSLLEQTSRMMAAVGQRPN